MHRTICLLFYCFCFHNASAQDYHLTGGAAGTGHAQLANAGLWSVFYNPGGIGEVDQLHVGLFYDNRFALADLGMAGMGLTLPVQEGRAGLSYTRFGNSLFNEQTIGLAFGRRLGEKVSAGIKLNFHSLQIANGYGNDATLTGDIGFLFHLSESLTLAGSIHNPTRSRFVDTGDERLPVVIKGGGQFAFSEAVQLNAEVWKELNEKPQLRTGLSYRVIEKLFLQAGMGSNPTLTSFGIGALLGPVRLDIAAAHHSNLGFSPQMSMVYVRPE